MTDTLNGVRDVLAEILGIEDSETDLTPQTPLLGSIETLDSMAVVEVLAGLEDRFGITIDDGAVSADVFETVGSLVAFVDEHQVTS